MVLCRRIDLGGTSGPAGCLHECKHRKQHAAPPTKLRQPPSGVISESTCVHRTVLRNSMSYRHRFRSRRVALTAFARTLTPWNIRWRASSLKLTEAERGYPGDLRSRLTT